MMHESVDALFDGSDGVIVLGNLIRETPSFRAACYPYVPARLARVYGQLSLTQAQRKAVDRLITCGQCNKNAYQIETTGCCGTPGKGIDPQLVRKVNDLTWVGSRAAALGLVDVTEPEAIQQAVPGIDGDVLVRWMELGWLQGLDAAGDADANRRQALRIARILSMKDLGMPDDVVTAMLASLPSEMEDSDDLAYHFSRGWVTVGDGES